MAGIGVGLYQDVQDAFEHVGRPGKTYQPNESLAAKYAEGFETYRELYKALTPINQRL